MTNPTSDKKPKTYKRELGGAMFIWLVYLVETKEVELVATLAPPIFMYIAFAMGADVYHNIMHKKDKNSTTVDQEVRIEKNEEGARPKFY